MYAVVQIVDNFEECGLAERYERTQKYKILHAPRENIGNVSFFVLHERFLDSATQV